MDLESLYGQDVIAYGTGVFANTLIPSFLCRIPELKLRGVTNSKVQVPDGGAFLDTGLPIRSIEAWAELFPNATVLVTTTDKHYSDIFARCQDVGFTTVIRGSEWLEVYYRNYLQKRGVLLEGECISLGGCNLLNPFTDEAVVTSDFLFELSDLVMPDFDEGWDHIQEGPYTLGGVDLLPGDIVLDCGANLGIFSAFAASKGCLCYAFEPTPTLEPLIMKQSKWNGNRIQLVQAAVSDKAGTVSFHICEGSANNFLSEASLSEADRSKRGEVTEIRVRQTTIDDFVEERQLSHVDFIKADIEGAERLMLAGAQKTLAKFAPKLSICTYHCPDDKEVLTDLILKANPNYQIEYKWMKLYAHVPTEKR